LNETNLQEKVKLLGPFPSSVFGDYHCFFMDVRKHNVIIEIPPLMYFDAWLEKLKNDTNIEAIEFFIVQMVSLNHGGVINRLMELGFHGTIITTYFFARPLLDAFPSLKVITIDELGRQLYIEGSLAFKFIPMAFLPHPQMFMTYHVTSGILFSSVLFSSLNVNDPSNKEERHQALFDFHKMTMPSSEYLKEPLRRITHLPLQAILPTFGNHYLAQEVPPLIEQEFRLDFYNTRNVFTYDAKGQKDFNYLEISNHLIVTLLKTYDKDHVFNLFKDSPFTINDTTLEISTSAYSGYQLYNEIFKHLYAVEGGVILALLEPLVSLYQNQYGLTRPAIYNSKMVEIQQEMQALEQEKRLLKQQIGQLEARMRQASTSLLRDANTGLFNEQHLFDVLKADFQTDPHPPYVRGLLMVRIGQLVAINQKYGKATGDESLRHLSYLINQLKESDDVLFKLNGPDLLLYQKETTTERLLATTIKIRNAVAESKLFIEKVSLASALFTSDEIDVSVIDDKIRQAMQTLEGRLKVATSKGKGQISDRHTSGTPDFTGNILLIDEDDINRNMLTRIFASIKYDVITAQDVLQAMEILEKHSIDIIISEINLTKIDGFAFKQTLNETKTYANIPFIIVSHSKTVANIRRANLLDIDLMLEKPVIPEELIGHVARLKTRRQASL
jgi:diguanylate cyclase (GGDEF)-like protein